MSYLNSATSVLEGASANNQTSSIDQEAAFVAVMQNAVSSTPYLPPPPYTFEEISGILYWVSEPKDSRFIVITPDNGKTDSDGKILNLGIVLNNDATVEFSKQYKNCIFDGDRIVVSVRVLRGATLAENLSAGHGQQGNKNYLIGMALTLGS
jgi:hypothetical protein